jgi:lipopolysaccharide export system ATP-binding protein
MKDKIIIQNISKSYNKKPILSDISIEVSQGESIGLFGPNGAGKTTLFSIIIGIVKTDTGRLYLGNHDITNLPIHIRSQLGISYLPQESSIFRSMNVRDNIKAILEIKNSDKEEIDHKATELLNEFSISHLENKIASTLSGGERRRLEIARTLASNPRFILLDEPLAGIDPIAVNDIKHLISHLKERNIGILVTDHNVRETLDMVDRTYVIYDGKILMAGTPEEIINSAKVRELYLGNNFDRIAN